MKWTLSISKSFPLNSQFMFVPKKRTSWVHAKIFRSYVNWWHCLNSLLRWRQYRSDILGPNVFQILKYPEIKEKNKKENWKFFFLGLKIENFSTDCWNSLYSAIFQISVANFCAEWISFGGKTTLACFMPSSPAHQIKSLYLPWTYFSHNCLFLPYFV